jgi:hypothetical protein
MTTKLLPRLIATGALAAGLTAVSALTSLANSAHATAAVTDARAIDGSIKVQLNISDLHMASRSQAIASGICTSQIIPVASTMDADLVPYPVCAAVVYQAATTYVGQGVPVQISFYAGHTSVSAVRAR